MDAEVEALKQAENKMNMKLKGFTSLTGKFVKCCFKNVGKSDDDFLEITEEEKIKMKEHHKLIEQLNNLSINKMDSTSISDIWCSKCKNKTPNVDIEDITVPFKNKNGEDKLKSCRKSKCAICGAKKFSYVKA